ncbi:MAG: OmpA family protein [Deltaproteobacteria bacterium]|nr:OmpA family protein [Deltaproteobacteria bacterium]MBI3391327.1 OmpA family protein [Deltaproteobacteria bacterium]
MRVTTFSLISVLICGTSGCFWKTSVPVPTAQRIVLHGIVDFNKAQIRPDSIALLDEAALMLKGRQDLRIIAEGHSDSKGSDEFNQKLSLRRATAVRNYLVRVGVPMDRIVVVGKGASEPIASNATREGRAQNRRVVLRVVEE